MSASENNSVPGMLRGCSSPRRGFLSTLAALGAAAVLPGESLAQGAKKSAARSKPYRIDDHHHLIYPGYLDEIAGSRAGSPVNWAPAMSIERVDKNSIALSVVALVRPSGSAADLA